LDFIDKEVLEVSNSAKRREIHINSSKRTRIYKFIYLVCRVKRAGLNAAATIAKAKKAKKRAKNIFSVYGN
jgi:hypothetical protein